ncbi:helix-turn-helix domain-containing protein [Streptomyces parvulus]
MAELVNVRRLTDQEGQKLQQMVRRGSTSSVRYRRAMMLLASADGNRVPVIAKLVQADEDTVRDVIHRFNEIGLACLDPRWAGGRPRLLSPDDEDFVVQTATTKSTYSAEAGRSCAPATTGKGRVDLPRRGALRAAARAFFSQVPTR